MPTPVLTLLMPTAATAGDQDRQAPLALLVARAHGRFVAARIDARLARARFEAETLGHASQSLERE